VNGLEVDALELIVLALASYRITRFLVRDSLIGFGPDSGSAMSVRVDRFAYFSTTDAGPDGTDRSWLRGKIGDLLTCMWCLGFWVSAAVYLVWIGTAPVLEPADWSRAWEAWNLTAQDVVAIFAIAGAQGYVSSRINA